MRELRQFIYMQIVKTLISPSISQNEVQAIMYPVLFYHAEISQKFHSQHSGSSSIDWIDESCPRTFMYWTPRYINYCLIGSKGTGLLDGMLTASALGVLVALIKNEAEGVENSMKIHWKFIGSTIDHPDDLQNMLWWSQCKKT